MLAVGVVDACRELRLDPHHPAIGPDHDEVHLVVAVSSPQMRHLRFGCLVEGFEPAASSVQLSQRALSRALAAPTAAEVDYELAAGLPDQRQRADVTAALSGRRAAVAVRVKPVGGRRSGLEIAWACGPAGAWELPVSLTPLVTGAEASASVAANDSDVQLSPLGDAEAMSALGQALSLGAAASRRAG